MQRMWKLLAALAVVTAVMAVAPAPAQAQGATDTPAQIAARNPGRGLGVAVGIGLAVLGAGIGIGFVLGPALGGLLAAHSARPGELPAYAGAAQRSCRASRSWPSSTSPNGACRRTDASRSRCAAPTSISAFQRSRRPWAKAS